MRSIKRFSRVLGSATVAVSLLGAVGLATAAPASAANSPKGVSGFDGTYSGVGVHYVSLTARQLAVSPSRLGSGSVTFTTTVTADKQAAQWSCSSSLCDPELIIAGLRQAHPAKPDTRLFGDGSLLYGQDNSLGAGYCTNDKFISSSGAFVFGNGGTCYVHAVPPYGSQETYSVTISGNNDFKDVVYYYPGGVKTVLATFAGVLSLPPTTEYYPAVSLLPGRTPSDRTSTWTFTVAASSYS